VITFEENPADFVQQDIEGGDNDTRRRVASDLVRAMGRHFAEEVSWLRHTICCLCKHFVCNALTGSDTCRACLIGYWRCR